MIEALVILVRSASSDSCLSSTLGSDSCFRKELYQGFSQNCTEHWFLVQMVHRRFASVKCRPFRIWVSVPELDNVKAPQNKKAFRRSVTSSQRTATIPICEPLHIFVTPGPSTEAQLSRHIDRKVVDDLPEETVATLIQQNIENALHEFAVYWAHLLLNMKQLAEATHLPLTWQSF
ncbi:hypothetical protein L596_005692 [Steinernema carpocapsae]|uniref:Uncharacterized protein n=1 Tax=Steinernema carpocapsae TaxID=34508 RepID=A0A4U8V584_STECR|nr:hypothetical protein L596_005692 [Steinernema carpocapsae]